MIDANDPRSRNVDNKVVEDFGREWQAFDQSKLGTDELSTAFADYFELFPFERLGKTAAGFDMGCGSGRWAKVVAPKVGRLICVDASPTALAQARNALKDQANCQFECASVGDTSIPDASQDFGYSLGVLHHVPDTLEGLKSCVRKLKQGAPFLVYLYYAFDNRPSWFRGLWRASDIMRRGISRLPFVLKLPVSQLIAVTVYFPLARLAWIAEWSGFGVHHFPLAAYRAKSFYTMRTDALDRFGTSLERRFTRKEIEEMMRTAGLGDIRFNDHAPYWCAVGNKT